MHMLILSAHASCQNALHPFSACFFLLFPLPPPGCVRCNVLKAVLYAFLQPTHLLYVGLSVPPFGTVMTPHPLPYSSPSWVGRPIMVGSDGRRRERNARWATDDREMRRGGGGGQGCHIPKGQACHVVFPSTFS